MNSGSLSATLLGLGDAVLEEVMLADGDVLEVGDGDVHTLGDVLEVIEGVALALIIVPVGSVSSGIIDFIGDEVDVGVIEGVLEAVTLADTEGVGEDVSLGLGVLEDVVEGVIDGDTQAYPGMNCLKNSSPGSSSFPVNSFKLFNALTVPLHAVSSN